MLGPRDLVFSSVPVAHVPLLDRLAPARAAGFAGLSLLPGDVWALEDGGMDAREIAGRIADHGLEVAEVDCIGFWLPSQVAASGGEHDAILRTLTPERVLGAAARVGARSVVVVEMFGVTPSLDEAAEAFATLCDQAADHGLIAHIEFLPFGGIPDLMSAWRIVEAAGRKNGGLTIDSWHLFRSGSTLAQLAQIPGAHIGSVQLNDGPARPQGALFEETMSGRRLPGDGAFDLTGLLRTLEKIGSRAPLGVEVFSVAQNDQSIDEIARRWAQSAKAVIHQQDPQRP